MLLLVHKLNIIMKPVYYITGHKVCILHSHLLIDIKQKVHRDYRKCQIIQTLTNVWKRTIFDRIVSNSMP